MIGHNKKLRVIISSRSIIKALNKQFTEDLDGEGEGEGGIGISAKFSLITQLSAKFLAISQLTVKCVIAEIWSKF